MANTTQAKKMIRKIKTKTAYNKWWKTKVKNAIKALDEIVSKPEASKESAMESYKALQQVVDKAQKNGVIKKNKANRIKSQKALTQTEKPVAAKKKISK